MADFAALRARMVERQLRRRGIRDERVLEAMGTVPREMFVPPRMRHRAYADSALPIGEEQTISQPWIVAAICQAMELTGSERVLEVGTGSGYSTAVLSLIAAEVISVERHASLTQAAYEVLSDFHHIGVGTNSDAAIGGRVANVELLVGDGSRGVPERAPFEAIAVHASAPAAPPALVDQLTADGRLVVPIAAESVDMLTLLRRRPGGRIDAEAIGPCRFVPLIGQEGF
jgi:protein-L-isoaspartate(D-aspartate) O-methyltransferase